MSTFTKDMIKYYADKLLIGLTAEENKMVLDEFDEINQNIDLINKIDGIENIEPMSHCLNDFEFVLREDVVEPSIPIEVALSNCDNVRDDEVKVPKVVE